MKKSIAIILALLMLFSAVPIFAATTSDEVIFHYKEAEKSSKWAASVTLTNYDGGAQAWCNVKGETLVYTIDGIEKGNYEAFYWVVPHEANLDEMTFIVDHNGKKDKVSILTNPFAGGVGTSQWVSMGIMDFSGSGDETFSFVHPGGGHGRATAIKLVPTVRKVNVSNPVEEENTENVETNDGKQPSSESQTENITTKPSGTCTWTGDWAFSTAVNGPVSGYRPSMWIAGVGEEATVTYNPQIEAVGDINIFVYLCYWSENQNPQVKYAVHHNGKVDEVVLDPTVLTESKWVYLGTFDFAGDMENEFVQLICVPNEDPKLNTRASTIMFEIVNSANGGIWSTKYVTPKPITDTAEILEKAGLASLDQFADMKDHWANYDVEYMANEGLVQGVAEGVFDPEANITRAEYVTILDRAMGYEAVNADSYADVAADQWYYPYVAAAKNNGLLNGLPTDDGFKPEQPITREEMALFTYNAIQATKKNDEWVKNLPDDYVKFTDTAEVSSWAEEALQYLIQTGIIKGTTDTTVSAKENATRAQGAVILKRFMQAFVWAGPPTDDEWTLMFSDEFNGTEMDWSVWRSEAGSVGHILSSRWPENAEVHDGALHLMVRREDRGGQDWTAASVWVRPQVFAQTYGYWEARYKYAAGPGVNNSFWTYVPHSHNIHKDPDMTTHFELDINEGHYPNTVNTNYHSWVSGERVQYGGSYASEYNLSVDYHTYALEWTPEKLIYYFDGKVIDEKDNLNVHQLQFPYLSAAVINWAGTPTDDTDGTAQIVDYVRVWQRKADADNPALNYKGDPIEGIGASEEVNESFKNNSELGKIPVVTVAEQEVDNTTYDGEIIIEGDYEGDWRTSSAIQNWNGGAHMWTDSKGATSVYSLAKVTPGKYKIYMWRLPHVWNIDQMDMVLEQDGEKTLVGSLALKIAADETAEAGWVLLGEHELTGDKNANISYTCEGVNCRVTAIKLVPVK